MSASAPRALFAGPGAARALVTGLTGVVEHTFAAGAYLRFGPDWVLLSERAAPFGPLSLIARGLPDGGPAVQTPVAVRGEQLVLGDVEVSLARVRERRAPALAVSPGSGRDAVAALAAVAALPPPPLALRAGIDALCAGRIAEGVCALAGLGDGLTPAGDDVLTGAAAVLSEHDGGHGARMSTLAARRASALGLAYMCCAERGELPDPGAALLVAIRRGSERGVRAALEQLRGWGASSGSALAWGICAGVAASADAVICHAPAHPQ